MRLGYVDTSCLVAIAFGEHGSEELARELDQYTHLLSSNLLEAELRSAMSWEKVAGEAPLLERLTWIFPDRRLTTEVDRVLSVGYSRGADLWHLASALYVAESPADLVFLTLDGAQRRLASALGFASPE